MDNLVIPTIEWPFRQMNHADITLIDEETNRWTKKFFFVACEQIEDQKFTYFSGRIWNYGSYERVLAISKMVTLFFIADNYFDFANADWTEHKCRRMLEIARKDEIVAFNDENWIEASFSDVWQVFASFKVEKWKQRFIEALKNWFDTAVLELRFRQTKKIPSFADYLTLRPFSTGSEFCFSFIEFAAEKHLSYRQLSNAMFQATLQHCRYVLFATNDLYSYRKEVRDGDVMNLAMVFQKEYNISAQEAIYKIAGFIKEEINMYLCCKKQLTTLFPDQFDFFLFGLESMMRGNYDFHFDSKRYETA